MQGASAEAGCGAPLPRGGVDEEVPRALAAPSWLGSRLGERRAGETPRPELLPRADSRGHFSPRAVSFPSTSHKQPALQRGNCGHEATRAQAGVLGCDGGGDRPGLWSRQAAPEGRPVLESSGLGAPCPRTEGPWGSDPSWAFSSWASWLRFICQPRAGGGQKGLGTCPRETGVA